jgi:hypothetical protein
MNEIPRFSKCRPRVEMERVPLCQTKYDTAEPAILYKIARFLQKAEGPGPVCRKDAVSARTGEVSNSDQLIFRNSTNIVLEMCIPSVSFRSSELSQPI